MHGVYQSMPIRIFSINLVMTPHRTNLQLLKISEFYYLWTISGLLTNKRVLNFWSIFFFVLHHTLFSADLLTLLLSSLIWKKKHHIVIILLSLFNSLVFKSGQIFLPQSNLIRSWVNSTQLIYNLISINYN
jgi:hypothetical protein